MNSDPQAAGGLAAVATAAVAGIAAGAAGIAAGIAATGAATAWAGAGAAIAAVAMPAWLPAILLRSCCTSLINICCCSGVSVAMTLLRSMLDGSTENAACASAGNLAMAALTPSANSDITSRGISLNTLAVVCSACDLSMAGADCTAPMNSDCQPAAEDGLATKAGVAAIAAGATMGGAMAAATGVAGAAKNGISTWPPGPPAPNSFCLIAWISFMRELCCSGLRFCIN